MYVHYSRYETKSDLEFSFINFYDIESFFVHRPNCKTTFGTVGTSSYYLPR